MERKWLGSLFHSLTFTFLCIKSSLFLKTALCVWLLLCPCFIGEEAGYREISEPCIGDTNISSELRCSLDSKK